MWLYRPGGRTVAKSPVPYRKAPGSDPGSCHRFIAGLRWTVFNDFDLRTLRHVRDFGFYFRYPLHHRDFHEVRDAGKLLGRFAAKPLYGRLTPAGKVDRSAGFNGRVAVIFVPARARTARSARVVLTRMRKDHVQLGNGRRNWPAIRAAAERAIRRELRRRPAT